MSDARVLVLQHDALATLGWLGDVLADVGAEVNILDLRSGTPVPVRVDADAVVSLGGDMGAYDDEQFGWLAAERALLREAAVRDVPVLGICLGAQLLAAALGGRAYVAGEPEVGFYSLDLTEAGRDDPVLRHLDAPMLLWHGDTFEMPPGAELLATSPRFVQAFRLGRTLGLQFHPETSLTMLRGWADALRGEPHLSVDALDALVSDAARHGGRSRDCARQLFRAWVEEAGLTGITRVCRHRR